MSLKYGYRKMTEKEDNDTNEDYFQSESSAWACSHYLKIWYSFSYVVLS